MTKLAVITDSLSDDLETAIGLAAAEGVRHLELQSVWKKRLSDLTDDEVAHVRRMTADAGMTICCLSQKNLFGAMPVATTDAGDDIYKSHMRDLARITEIAAVLGTDLLRIMCFRKEMVLFGTGGAEDAVVTKGAWDKFVELMDAPVRFAEANGIRLAVENSTKGMVTSAFLARKLIDEIGSKSLRALWDPCNALYYGETPYPNGFDRLKDGYLAHIHIKDGVANIPEASMHFRALGDGAVGLHLSAIEEGLRRIGYEGYVSMESLFRPTPLDAAAGFRASVGRAQSHFGSMDGGQRATGR